MTTKKLTNRQKLFAIGEELLTAKEPEILEKLNTYIVHVSDIFTNGKLARIKISDEHGNTITYQFDKSKYWKSNLDLEKAHLVES